jgi:hypothetical protein
MGGAVKSSTRRFVTSVVARWKLIAESLISDLGLWTSNITKEDYAA